MNQWSEKVKSQLSKRNKYVIPVVELYSRDTVDITSLSAPANAFGRFSLGCVTWTNSTGSYEYLPKVLGFSDLKSYLGSEINNAKITLGNAERGDNSMSRFILNNKIKGCWAVIRLIFPDEPDESLILFWGKCARPGEISNSTVEINISQELGNYKQEIPFRSYQVTCPLDFARPLGGCLGNETLLEKSIAYQEAVAKYGTAGCNKLFSTCTLLGNTRYFQGQRVVAVSGQFSYVTVEEVVKRVLFWTKRKKIEVVKTDSWSSVNQSEGSEIVPLAFGRCQLQGHPFTWADVGTSVKSLQGFCEGKISAYSFIRSRTQGIQIVSTTEHLGDWGGVGTQQLDTLFNGSSGHNSKLAYLEIVTNGSSPTQVDSAPIITAVIRGIEIPVPDLNGNYTNDEWTNNGVHITRFILTDTRFAKVPTYRMDDAAGLETAADCDMLVEDRTNDEVIILPANEATNYDVTYRRYRSTGRYTAARDMAQFSQQEAIPLIFEFEGPDVDWFNPFEPYVVPERNVVLRQKYTCNGALQEKTGILDFLYKRILPTFKGYINYSPSGLIQIKNRRKADNGYLRMDTVSGALKVPVSNIVPWKTNTAGYLLIGVSLETAEIRQVTGFEYSTACNGMPVTGISTMNMVVATSGTVSGGAPDTPGLAWVDISGEVSAGAKVELSFNSGNDLFTVAYIADGVEDVPGFVRMLNAFLNANVQFQSYLTAYIDPLNSSRIWIRCEAGYLLLDKPLQYAHVEAEEVLRVMGVFENCGELTANESAQFDNIIADSFKWNTDKDEELNAITAKYISAIDDFHLTMLMPRAAWDTIDLEGELNKEELDLTFIDNYWQAAYITKGEAIDRIDGNLHFTLGSNILASQYELGDVVALRHDSGDGALNYIPVWVEDISLDLNKFNTKLGLKLYLSAAFDLHVQPVDPLLTTTLNAALQPEVLPPPIGTSGGVSTGTEPVVVRPAHESYYNNFQLSKYSPTGVDLV